MSEASVMGGSESLLDHLPSHAPNGLDRAHLHLRLKRFDPFWRVNLGETQFHSESSLLMIQLDDALKVSLKYFKVPHL